MTRNALYLILAASVLGACTGKVDLGDGDGGGGGGSGGSSGADSGVTMIGMGTSDAGITEQSDGSSVIGESDSGSIVIGPDSGIAMTDASVGSDDAGCFPHCMLPDSGISEDASSSGGFTLCGETECGPGESCIVTTTSGGPCIPPGDAGTCPMGTMLDGGCCIITPAPVYVCQITPPSCGGDLTCGCATSLCDKSEGCFCGGVSDNVLSCSCEAP